uniref:Uncharacterized protein n=1 Tax=Tanacetum cinerariifolium TaxID=118510 RepID=A0A6L2J3Q4_TANCI|nr:hypothetical protein [Tanacetum cinerariifolium]
MAKEFQPQLRSLILLQIFMVRSVLDLMRRGEHVCFKDHKLLDQSVFSQIADIHDRHRDMPLDIDNMSYDVVGIESIEPVEMCDLNMSVMEVEGLMSQVSTSIPDDVVRSKASDLSTIDGDTSEFSSSLNIQVGASKLVVHIILLVRIRTMFVVYVMKDANVANVVNEQKHVLNNDHVACEKKVEEVNSFKGYWNTRWDLL